MIEINLLPVELRQAEGTPLPRLMSILGGALAATLGAVLVANYLIIDIPKTKQAIKTATEDKNKKEEEKKKVMEIQAEIDMIQKKVAALTNLERNRVRWARLLVNFRKCVPENCVVRSFHITPMGQAGDGSAGRKFKLTIQGSIAGDSNLDCVKKLTEMWNLFKTELGPKEVKTPAGGPDVPPANPPAGAPPATGQLSAQFNKWMGLRFEEPVIQPYNIVTLGDIPVEQLTPEQRRSFRKPAMGLDFTLDMQFALPPPVQ